MFAYESIGPPLHQATPGSTADGCRHYEVGSPSALKIVKRKSPYQNGAIIAQLSYKPSAGTKPCGP